MPHARGDGLDRTDKRVAAESKTDHFATNCVLLVSERKSDNGGAIEVERSGSRSKYAPVSDINGDVLESERGIVGCRGGVFARPAEKEESDAEHGNHGQRFGGAVLLSNAGGVIDYQDRDGLDTVGRGVGTRVAPYLSG
jgi:hypothetical protein